VVEADLRVSLVCMGMPGCHCSFFSATKSYDKLLH